MNNGKFSLLLLYVMGALHFVPHKIQSVSLYPQFIRTTRINYLFNVPLVMRIVKFKVDVNRALRIVYHALST